MDRQPFDKLEQRLNSRIDQSTSKANRSIFLIFFFTLAILVFLAILAVYGNKNVIDHVAELESTIKAAQAPSAATPATQSNPTGISDSLNARLTSLEALIGAISNTSKGALDQMNLIFAIVTGVLGLVSFFFVYRQVMADTGREKNDQEMRGLVGSFRQNIDVINDLIVTLKESYDYRKDVDRNIKILTDQIEKVDKYRERTETNLNEKIDSLNQKAFQIFCTIDREKFKVEENKHILESFSANMNTLLQMGEITDRLSPFCYFLRALDFFNVVQYESARDGLEKADQVGFRECANPTMAQYKQVIEEEVVEQLRRMLDDCSYHLGIIYYNLGQYDKARERFQSAYSKNRLDFRSRSYIPELMFFETRIPFSRVISEFGAVERELNNVSLEDRGKFNWSSAMASLKMREGNCYLPKVIPLNHLTRVRDRSEESYARAASVYWIAYERANEIDRPIDSTPTLTEVFVQFSLAQALMGLSRSEWRDQTPHELFQKVFYDIRKQIVLKTEPILLVLLNYTLAICANQGGISGENPRVYLVRAREQLQHVPEQVLIFSPINKINLTREVILWEMETFEKSLS